MNYIREEATLKLLLYRVAQRVESWRAELEPHGEPPWVGPVRAELRITWPDSATARLDASG